MYRYVLECVSSKLDYAGNKYYALVYNDGEHVIEATVHGDNVKHVPFHLNGGSHEPHDYFYTETELPVRRFNQFVKGLEYAGCRGEDIAAYIQAKILEQDKAKAA